MDVIWYYRTVNLLDFNKADFDIISSMSDNIIQKILSNHNSDDTDSVEKSSWYSNIINQSKMNFIKRKAESLTEK